MVLIIGATGALGMEVCRLIAAQSKPAKALVRTSSDKGKVQSLKELGLEIAYGDLRKPATIEKALKAVDKIIVTLSSMPASYVPGENDIKKVDLEGMMKLVELASTSGVAHFVYVSFSGQLDSDFPLRNAKRAVETRLMNGDMDYTILRPSYFMEVWLTPAVGFDIANKKVRVYGQGTQPVSYISYLDVAKFAVASLENPLAKNATLELGGPEKISQLEVAKLFENVSVHKFEIQNVPKEALQSQLTEAEDPMQRSFIALMLCLAEGDPIDMEETAKAFGIKLKAVEDYAKGSV